MHQLARSLPLVRLREHPHEGGQRGRMIRPQKMRSSAMADDVAIQHKQSPRLEQSQHARQRVSVGPTLRATSATGRPPSPSASATPSSSLPNAVRDDGRTPGSRRTLGMPPSGPFGIEVGGRYVDEAERLEHDSVAQCRCSSATPRRVVVSAS